MPSNSDERPDAPAAKPKAARTRKRPAPQADSGDGKRSINLRIDQESYRRLNVHALMTDTTVSELVMGFARSLREYSMPHRLGGSAGQGGSDG